VPQLKQFKLPDVGEGLTEAEIVSWKVKPGDTIAVNETIVEIETAKSLVELPSPFAGVVGELMVDEGQTVDVGTPIISVDVDPSGASAPNPVDDLAPPMPAAAADTVPDSPVEVGTPPEEGAVEPGLIGGPAPGGRTSVLVGYGPRTTEAKRRPRAGSMAAPAPAPPAAASEVAAAPATTSPDVAPGERVLAKPPVRKLARDLGIDLAVVTPSGPGGVVTRDDVLAHADGAASPAAAPPAAGDRETRIPVKGVRKMTAQAMVASAFTAPHVTEFISVDVTRTMRLVDRLRADREFEGVKVSPLLVVAKALLLAVRRNPGINASWDEAAGEIVVKHYVNLGIAAATPRGLVVPNIKDAERMSLRELADALAALTATAREGRTQPADMSGGTISITNVGVFGVDSGTPILNPGEAAILAFGSVRERPWVHKGKVKPRWVTQLALSFDHRLVDGDLGSRFLADLAAVLEDPSKALVWG
jgi:2-oxoisovalerate dehydrogenase E2 component (dihydrolipoyl transacylase)